ncbi:hypothetical protein TSUD_24140 [Trifolium subterraneum]|uniref:Uncharacterized protein n=1 Tax=Trifolium subterraneum TaxID=3900 RepID=A0A2Z6P657_TRISU|nr:hypothetical protein TSUD_24140 [Trifolium subterraneum]
MKEYEIVRQRRIQFIQSQKDAIEREKKTKLESLQISYRKIGSDTNAKLKPYQIQKDRIAKEEKIILDDANVKYNKLQIEKDKTEADANFKLSRIR